MMEAFLRFLLKPEKMDIGDHIVLNFCLIFIWGTMVFGFAGTRAEQWVYFILFYGGCLLFFYGSRWLGYKYLNRDKHN